MGTLPDARASAEDSSSDPSLHDSVHEHGYDAGTNDRGLVDGALVDESPTGDLAQEGEPSSDDSSTSDVAPCDERLESDDTPNKRRRKNGDRRSPSAAPTIRSHHSASPGELSDPAQPAPATAEGASCSPAPTELYRKFVKALRDLNAWEEMRLSNPRFNDILLEHSKKMMEEVIRLDALLQEERNGTTAEV